MVIFLFYPLFFLQISDKLINFATEMVYTVFAQGRVPAKCKDQSQPIVGWGGPLTHNGKETTMPFVGQVSERRFSTLLSV